MDDQRDYEEERAQGAALREEQQNELAATTDDGIDRGQVDSSSPDYVGPEAEVTVDAEADERPEKNLTLAQIVNLEGIDFAGTWREIFSLCNFGSRTAEGMRQVYDHGLDPEPDKVTVELTALESQALSVGLNLVTLFEPRLAEYAESLLRRASQAVSELEMSQERRDEIGRHLEEMREEQEAMIFGFESVEQYREEKAKAEAARLDRMAADRQPEQGAPHLN